MHFLGMLLTSRPGALVLAHSLRDAGTTKKLAILVTLDSLSVEVVTQLKACLQRHPFSGIRRGTAISDTPRRPSTTTLSMSLEFETTAPPICIS